MKIVHVHVKGIPNDIATGKGATVASAVQKAAYQLFKRPGRTEWLTRTDTHTYEWHWRVGRTEFTLIVRENRSGPSGEASTRQVPLRLSDENAERLDGLARRRGLNRSALVVALVDAELQGETRARARR